MGGYWDRYQEVTPGAAPPSSGTLAVRPGGDPYWDQYPEVPAAVAGAEGPNWIERNLIDPVVTGAESGGLNLLTTGTMPGVNVPASTMQVFEELRPQIMALRDLDPSSPEYDAGYGDLAARVAQIDPTTPGAGFIDQSDARANMLLRPWVGALLNGNDARVAQIEQELQSIFGTSISAIAQQEQARAALPQDTGLAQAMEGGAWDTFSHLLTNPASLLRIGVESAVQSAPGFLGLPAGVPGTMMGIGLSSGGTDTAMSMLGYLREMGVDTTDPAAIEAALSDPGIQQSLWERASARGTVVGAVDALSGGVASSATRGIRDALITQPALGAAGEALGQVAAGDEFSPSEIVIEAVAELFGSSPEIVRGMMERARTEPAAETAPPPADPVLAIGVPVYFEDVQADGSVQMTPGTITRVDEDRVFVQTEDGRRVSVGRNTNIAPRDADLDALLSTGLTLQQAQSLSSEFRGLAAQRIRQAQQEGGSQQPLDVPQEQILQNEQRIAEDAAGVDSGAVDPAAARPPVQQQQPPPVIQVDSRGQAGTPQDFATAEAQAPVRADMAYDELAARIGEDPATLAAEYVGLSPEEFRAMAPETQERVIAAAQRAEAAQQPSQIPPIAVDSQARAGAPQDFVTAEEQAAARADMAYDNLAERIGRDPAEVAAQFVGMAPEEFRGLTPETQERVIAAAQRAEAAQQPSRIPPLAVDSRGQATTGLDAGAAAGQQAQAQAEAEVAEAFRLADVQRRRGPEYQEQRAQAEAAFEADQAYADLAERVGQDPATLANQMIGIDPNEFRALTPDAQERIVAAAQRLQSAQQPGPTLATSDAALSGNEGFTPAGEPGRYSPSEAPMQPRRTDRVEGQAENTDAPQSRTTTETLRAEAQQPDAGRPRDPRMAAGGSSRPFQMDQDSSNLSPDQTRQFREQADQRSEAEFRQAWENLEREWAERRTDQQRRQENDRARNRQNSSEQETTGTPPPRGPDGKFPVNENGFLVDEQGRVVRFPTKRAAARWAVDNEQGANFDMVPAEANSDAVYLRANDNYGRDSGNGGPNPGSSDQGPETDGAGNTDDMASSASGTGNGSRAGETASGDGARGSASTAQAAPGTGQVGGRTSGNGPENGRTSGENNSASSTENPAQPSADNSRKNQRAERTDESSTTLYAGLPIDKIVDWILRPFYENVRDNARDIIGLMNDRSRQSSAKRRGWLMRTVARIMSNPLTTSADSRARMWATIINSPTFERVASMLRVMAGDLRGMPATFRERFERVYGRWERDIYNALGDMRHDEAAQQQIKELVQNRNRIRQNGGPIHDAARQIAALLDRIEKHLRAAGVDFGKVDNYFPREVSRDAVLNNRGRFLQRAAQLYRQEKGMNAQDADAAAQAWLDEIVWGGDFDVLSTKATRAKESFSNRRVFGPRADALLNEFYEPHPIHSLMTYARRAARRSETASLFGDRFSQWPDMVTQIQKEAEAAGADPTDVVGAIEFLREYLATETGHGTTGQVNGAVRHAISALRMFTAMRYLDESLLTSLPEMIMPAIRAADLTRAVRDVFLTVLHTIKGMLRLPPSQKWAALRELTEDAGVLIGSVMSNAQLARFHGGDALTRLESTVANKYFRGILLTQFTDHNNILATDAALALLRRASKTIAGQSSGWSVGGREGAEALLRELGIPKGQEARFAAAMVGLGNQVPTSTSFTGAQADIQDMLLTAIHRFDRQAVQMGSASTRQLWASKPLGSIVFQLQAFAYAFTKNVLARPLNILKSEGVSGATKARLIGTFVPMLALLLPFTMGVDWMREEKDQYLSELFQSDPPRQLTESARIERALSRSGFFGGADAYLQAIFGTRYQKSPVETLIGPALGGAVNAATTAIQLFVQNNPNTNTAERNAVSQLLGFGVEPLMQAFVHMAIPAGLGSFLAAQVPDTGAPAIVDMVAGERSQASQAARQREISGMWDSLFGGPSRPGVNLGDFGGFGDGGFGGTDSGGFGDFGGSGGFGDFGGSGGFGGTD